VAIGAVVASAYGADPRLAWTIAAAWVVKDVVAYPFVRRAYERSRSATEALIGAVYLDGGFDDAAKLVERLWGERMRTPVRPLRDPKTILQEWAQARGFPTPDYRELARTGPHHDPEFRVAVVLPDRPPAEGIGSSKRAAEQAAAAAMLTSVGVPADKLDG